MWINRDESNTVAKADVPKAVTQERRRFRQQEVSPQEIGRALDDLVRMRCIQQSSSDPGRWWLREWVSVAYR